MLRELPAVDAVADLPVAGVPEQPPGRAATTAAPSDQAALDWAAVLTRLDQRRAAAIAAGSAPALAEVVDPGGPAFARDLATAQARQAAGLRVEGGRLAIQSVRPESTGTQQATLVVTDERAAYRLVDGDGAVVVSVPARASASWRVVLTGDGSSWRVYDATRAG